MGDLRPAVERRNPAAIGELLRQRRSQVDLYKRGDIGDKAHSGRFAIVCSLLGPFGDLAGRIAYFRRFGVAEALTAAVAWSCPYLALVSSGTDVACPLVTLLN